MSATTTATSFSCNTDNVIDNLRQCLQNSEHKHYKINTAPAKPNMPKTQKQSQLENRKTQEPNGRHFESQNGRHSEGEGISRGNPRANRSMGLSGYCTSSASSPIGRDNKHGWYEEHEKFVAIAAGSLSSVLLVGDSLVNGLARYHRVWSKYFKPLRALNFGVGGDRTQHVLWRIENGEIPLNLQVAFIHCGTNNLDRDNPDEIRDRLLQLFILYRRKNQMLTLLCQDYFQEIKKLHLGVIRLS